MPAKNRVTLSNQPLKQRPSAADRRAAHSAQIAGKQAQLKLEAAERRAKNASQATARGQ